MRTRTVFKHFWSRPAQTCYSLNRELPSLKRWLVFLKRNSQTSKLKMGAFKSPLNLCHSSSVHPMAPLNVYCKSAIPSMKHSLAYKLSLLEFPRERLENSPRFATRLQMNF